MSQRGIYFANDWISDAIDLLGAARGQGSPKMIDDWVMHLVADAQNEGITRDEIEEGVGDLDAYITDCLAEAADNGKEQRGSNSDPFR